MNNLNYKCDYCNKKLRPFKTKNDWKFRKMHKSCFKKKERQEMLNSFYKNQYNKYRNPVHSSDDEN